MTHCTIIFSILYTFKHKKKKKKFKIIHLTLQFYLYKCFFVVHLDVISFIKQFVVFHIFNFIKIF